MGYEPLKPETQEFYLKIWTHFVVGHFNQRQLAQLFQCNEDTIGNAIHWCADNRTQFTINILATAAQEAVEARLRDLSSDLIKAKETNPTNWNAVIGLYKLIQENEQMLWKFQAIVYDRTIIQITEPVTPQMESIHNFAKEIRKLHDDDRLALAAVLERINKREEEKPNTQA